MKKFLFLTLLALLLSSCTVLRSASKEAQSVPAFSSRLTLTFRTNDMEQSVGGSLRMRRDSAIQLSLSKFGIEGARLVFTPDSLLVLDKIGKRYYHRPYANVNALFAGGEGLSFERVQAFFWNDAKREHEEGKTRVLGIVSLLAKVDRAELQRLEGYTLAKDLRLSFEVMESPFHFDFRFAKFKENNDWATLTHVPANYREIDERELLRLFQKLP